MSAPFRYHLTEIADGRTVAYRRGGQGPVAVLLHESPRSSGAVMPLAQKLAERFTVIAFDTPGFGLSDALPLARPDADDFARALAMALDALGIDKAPVYGTHTGAVIAIAFALMFPQRTTALVLDGYPVFTAAEQEEALSSYLKPFAVDWEGTHLAWLASRVKDQFTVFPWYRRGQSARLPRSMVPPAHWQLVVVDLMSAGNAYREAYAAAFRFEGSEPASSLAVPTTITARSDDLLFAHLDRLGPLAPGVAIQRLGPDREAWANAIGDFMARGAAAAAPAMPAPPPLPDRPGLRPVRRIVHTEGGSYGLRITGDSSKPALILLPPIPGAAAGLDAIARQLAGSHQVIACDLPGCGVSTGSTTVDGIAAGLIAVCRTVSANVKKIVGIGESASIAAALAQALPEAELMLVHPLPDDADTRRAMVDSCVDVSPHIDGTQLLAAWHQLRDRALWAPWYQRDPEHALEFGIDPDPHALQAILTEWLRGGNGMKALLQAALTEPLQARLSQVAARSRLVALEGHPWAIDTQRLAQNCGARAATLPTSRTWT